MEVEVSVIISIVSLVRHCQTYQPEALHIISSGRRSLHHIADAAEASAVFESSPLDEALEHLPTPLAILLVARDATCRTDFLRSLVVASCGCLQALG